MSETNFSDQKKYCDIKMSSVKLVGSEIVTQLCPKLTILELRKWVSVSLGQRLIICHCFDVKPYSKATTSAHFYRYFYCTFVYC